MDRDLVAPLRDNFRLKDAAYRVKILTTKDEGVLLELCERCSDYFYLHEGGEPGREDVCQILKDLPPGKGYEDKFVLGIVNGKSDLIGVVDLVRDFPVKDEWIIGLLLLDPSERGKGLGRMINDYLASLASQYQADKLRIGVIENNGDAYRFWLRLGYYEIKRVPWESPNHEHIVIVMNYDII